MVPVPAAHVSASILTDSTLSVGDVAVDPAAALVAPAGVFAEPAAPAEAFPEPVDPAAAFGEPVARPEAFGAPAAVAALLCSVPLISTRLFR